MTFKAARQKMLGELLALGWAVKADLKVPHATSPDGEVRLWFKAQAVHFTGATRPFPHDFHNARALTYDLDIRVHGTATVIALAMARTGRARQCPENLRG